MTEHAKNVIVGLTVILALGLLGCMIILFTGLPTLLRTGYEVRVSMDARSEVEVGDKVYLGGIDVATVTDIAFANPDDPYAGIIVTTVVNRDVTLPGNTVMWVTKRPFGRPWIELFADGDPLKDPETGTDVKFLSKDTPHTIPGRSKEASLLPDELAPALKGLATLSKNLNRLIAPPPTTVPATGRAPTTSTAPRRRGLTASLHNLNVTLDGLAAVFGDVENRSNIKTALAKLATAADKANKAMDAMKLFADEARKSFGKTVGSADTVVKRVDKLALKLIDAAENISKLLSTVNRIALKLEKGQGTAGKLINDPKLYNNLLEATSQITTMLKEFSDLVKTLKEHGIKVDM